MSEHIQLRRDTAANWTANNPVLLLGEVGVETSTTAASADNVKIGDGTTPWTSLPYSVQSGAFVGRTGGTTQSAAPLPFLNVTDFGAKGDNATDNLAAITAALAALGAQGGCICFPAGIFRVSGTIFVAQNNVLFIGAGPGATEVLTTSATADLFSFGDDVTLYTFFTVAEMYLGTTVPRTAGSFIRARKTVDLAVERCRLDGGFYGIDLLDTQITRLTDLHIINSTPTTGVAILANSTGTGTELHITRCDTDNPAGSQPLAGLQVQNWDGLWITDSTFNHSGTGCLLAPTTGNNCEHIFAVNCSFDTNSADGLATPAGGGVVQRAWFLGCWFGSNGNNGVRIDGGALGLSFVQPKLFANGEYGLLITSATYVDITDVQASGNSAAASGTYDALHIDANMSHVTISGGWCMPFAGFPNTQKYGIGIDSGVNHANIQNVDVSGNVAGGINNLSAGTDVLIRNNRGYVTSAAGTVNQPAASGDVVVTHGLDVTPSLQDITITACTDLGACTKFYISNPTSTTFQINTNGAPGNIVTWSWQVTV